MKYVSDWTGFSSDYSEQSGNYLALKFEVTPPDAVTTVEILGGTKGPVQLDSDMNIVLLIRDKDAQKVKAVCAKSGNTETKVFGLSGLICESQS